MTRPAPLLRLALVLVVPLFLSNCMTDASQTAATTEGAAATAADPGLSGTATARPAAVSALASADMKPSEYRISPRDVLDISVFQVADLTKSVQVGEDGNIILPLIGKTRVAGKTTDQAEQIIADKLKMKYLQSPQVAVSIKQFGQRVTVSGAVSHPTVLAADGRLTLSQSVVQAGGVSDVGNSERVHIARTTGGDGVDDQVYNFNEIVGGRTPDPVLQAGDFVVVENLGVRVALKNVKDLLPFAIFASIF